MVMLNDEMKPAPRKYKPGKIRDRNQEIILDAALEEFVLKGFNGATVQAIADRAELPKANVHYYFKNKSNLYVAVLDGILQLWNDSLEDIKEDDDPAQVIDLWVRQKVALSYTHARSSKLFAMEIIQGAPHLKEYMRNEMLPWLQNRTAVLEKWIADGKIQCREPVHLIFLIWSSTQHYADFEIQALSLLEKEAYEAEMMENIGAFLSETILRGIGLERPENPAKVVMGNETNPEDEKPLSPFHL